ncbi:MAG: sulfatase-like hydrolase/transferase [Clostridia bacterium]|nr:sulfatase-like hydrolase/transferase [Clostridia bacterium]
MRNFVEKIKEFLLRHKHGIITLLYALLSSTLIYYGLELGNKNALLNGVFYTFVNILTVFTLQAAVFILFQRWWISALAVGIPLTALSIANYYTLLYRNSPISTQDIHNAGTALSVLDSYQFPLNVFVLGIVLFFALNIAVTIQLYKREKKQKRSFKKSAIQSICLVLFCGIFLHSVYFSDNPIKPRNTFVWSWEDSYYRYGYAASSIEVFQNSLNMINTPDGYTPEALDTAKESRTARKTAGNTPDIIFILNETFYDMRDLVDIETDVPITPFIDSLKTTGKTVVAGTGGGTNKSEYELLTSNSLQLMPAITPFNYLNFDNANSIVSYLKQLGYKTWGAHCAEALNYERGIVYPKLGFDQVLFDVDFGEKERLADRPYATDEFVYGKMLEDYEGMGDAPRFMYMLTIQNHGGWDINPPESDTVHSLTDFGEYTDDINEFLSCVNESDRAFRQLTEYFTSHERDVIICMVGDHAPSFATALVDASNLDVTFNLRTTPFAIWANFDMEYSLPRELSMPFIAPSVLEAAGVPLSPYYTQMLKMRQETPVITAFNLYKTKNNEIFNYADNTEYKHDIDIYFDMVYNNVADNKKRIDRIFAPVQ